MTLVDLSVKFAGVEFKNPVWIASHGPVGPWSQWPLDKDAPEIFMKLYRKYYQQGVSAVITGCLHPHDLNRVVRGQARNMAISTRGFAKREGLLGNAIMPDGELSHTNGMELLRRFKKEFSDMRLIANIMGTGADGESWANLALESEQNGADMVELNLACNVNYDSVQDAMRKFGKKEGYTEGAAGGILLGLVPELSADIIKAIRKKVSIPIIAKITPELGFFRLIPALKVYKEAGADAVTCSHGFTSVAPPDIYRGGRTTFPNMEISASASVIGPWSRFGAYRDVSATARYGEGLEISGCGGLVIPEHVIEIMMLGAKTTQLSAGIFWNGIGYCGQVLKFMKKYMEEQGYSTVNDFIGLGQKYIRERVEVAAEWRKHIWIAQIDYDVCRYPTCDTCLDTWCFATEVEGDQVKINPDLCSGCNFCVIRCPYEARKLIDLAAKQK